MSYISYTEGKILLADKNKIPRIYIAEEDRSIIRAAKDLCDDFKLVTGAAAQIIDSADDADIIIRKEHSGLWESYKIYEEKEKLIICGSDKRGTIYGIYDLSRKIGVSPWYWWADVTPVHREMIYFNLDEPYVHNEPSVKYRGLFINDEECFAQWAMEKGDYDFVEAYKRVFELLLRLRANILWPAMHACSPYFHKNPDNAKNADLYGIIMGASHCELMLRNNVYEYFPFEEKWERENPNKPLYKKVLGDSPVPCAYVFTDTDPDTGKKVYNKELIRDYWRESVELFGQYENMYTVGMRGIHDYPWQPVNADTPEEKARIIEEAIAMQREIIEEYTGESAKNIPQLFVPYKEILEIYNSGMEVPDDITLMWTNDNYGYIRQLPTDTEKKRSGSAGMYYHLAYCGKPTSYLWLSTTPFALMREELSKAYNNGIDRVWIANAGDIKAAERQAEYFLDLAWDIDKGQDIKSHIKNKAMRDFNFDEETADEFAQTDLEFQRLAFSRKPEFFKRNLFNLKAFNDEGERYIKEYDKILQKSEAIYEKVEEDLKNAYFELHLYHLRACRNTAYQYITMDEQKQHLDDGYKLAAEKYIYMSDNAFYNIMEDTKKYHSANNGKWNHIMDSSYGFYVERKTPCPLLECSKEWGEKDGLGAVYEKMTFSGYTKDRRFIDIFNPFWLYTKWTMKTEFDFIIPDKAEGRVLKDNRVWINIDYDNAPKEVIETDIVITSEFGDNIVIPVVIDNVCEELQAGTFAETNGYVSIMAENMSRKTSGGTAHWETEKYLGREGNSIKVYSDKKTMELSDTAVAEYDTYFKTTGEFEVEIYRIPTLNERGKVRFAIGINDEDVQVIECNNKYINFSKGTDTWGAGVLANCEVLTARVKVGKKGINTVKLYAVDEDVIIEKIVVWTGDKIKSYFGPQETRIK